MAKVNIKDIAKACGVSIATVSRAINGTTYVKPELKGRILQYLDDIGWRSNSLSYRGFGSEEPKRLVMILSSIGSLDWDADRLLLRECVRLLAEKGYSHVMIFGSLASNLEKCLALKPYAVLLAGLNQQLKSKVAELLDAGIRVVTIGEDDDFAGPINFIAHRSWVKKAAALLRNAGHEKIGFFGGLGMAPGLDKAEPRVSHRLREMLAGLKESVPGFDPEKDAVSDRFDDLSGISKALAEGTHSAWICGELKLCQMLCHCVAKLGLRIPEDVSVAAFTQNLPLYALPGDICRFHSDNPARAAAIISLLEGDFVKDFTPMASECLFIEGASVAAPNPRFKLKTGKAS